MECNFVKAGTVRKKLNSKSCLPRSCLVLINPALVSRAIDRDLSDSDPGSCKKPMLLTEGLVSSKHKRKKSTLYYTGIYPNRKLFLYALIRKKTKQFSVRGSTRARLVKLDCLCVFPASNKLHNAPRNKRAPASL